MTDHVTTGERYARASVTKNMKMEEHACDADKLLAAGYAQAGDERKMIALRLYRMQNTGDRSALGVVATHASGMLHLRVMRKNLRPLPAATRDALIVQTMRWWLDQRCPYCNGTGFDLMEGAPALSMQACAGCEGTGRTPLKRAVPPRLYAHADWLTHEWDLMCAEVIGDMARILAAM